MFNKFDRVLSDECLREITEGLVWSSGDSIGFGVAVAGAVQEAISEKLVEQKPVAWRFLNKTTGFYRYKSYPVNGIPCEPLYTHPIPYITCFGVNSTKAAINNPECLSDKEWYAQNEKFEGWAKEHDHDLVIDDYGEYEDWTTRELWNAWQSSYLANRYEEKI